MSKAFTTRKINLLPEPGTQTHTLMLLAMRPQGVTTEDFRKATGSPRCAALFNHLRGRYQFDVHTERDFNTKSKGRKPSRWWIVGKTLTSGRYVRLRVAGWKPPTS